MTGNLALHPAGEFDQELVAFRMAGAERFDPVGLRFLEAFAQRTVTQRGKARQVLDLKLKQAFGEFRERLALAGSASQSSFPLPTMTPGPLGVLASQMNQKRANPEADHTTRHAANRDELNTAQYFRQTLSRLNTNKQIAKAIDQAPKNAGPINSHGLVLRSLALMRDVSPDYLNRFVSYVDALLVLESASAPVPKGVKPGTGKGVPKNKTPSARRTTR